MVSRRVPVVSDLLQEMWNRSVLRWSRRAWVVLHLIQETARHAGHADIIRESIDGVTAFPLPATVEDRPATSSVKPWQTSTS